MDHDQRLKTLLREFFAEFFQLFFPAWAERFDFTRIEWLAQEIFLNPPQGERRRVDMVAKLPTCEGVPGMRPGQAETWLALIHVEPEYEDRMTSLRPRMFDYYVTLRRDHGLPVLPIALYLHVGGDGVGEDSYEERFWELPILRFNYLCVGLPALSAEEYVQGENWLGVALSVFMRRPRERSLWLAAEALRRIQECPHNEYRRFLLGECILAYLPLDEEQRQKLQNLLKAEPYRGVNQMTTTWYDLIRKEILEKEGEQIRAEAVRLHEEARAEEARLHEEARAEEARLHEEARAEGRAEEARLLLRTLLEDKFGPLSDSVQQRIGALSAERARELARASRKAESLRDLGLED